MRLDAKAYPKVELGTAIDAYLTNVACTETVKPVGAYTYTLTQFFTSCRWTAGPGELAAASRNQCANATDFIVLFRGTDAANGTIHNRLSEVGTSCGLDRTVDDVKKIKRRPRKEGLAALRAGLTVNPAV